MGHRRVPRAQNSRPLMVVAALVMLMTACSGGRPSSILGDTTYAPDDGPLQVAVGEGGFAFAPRKRHGEWSGSFGQFPLCTSNDGALVRLVGVNPNVVVKPDQFAVWTHHVAAGKTESQSFISALGSPPEWKETYADTAYGGRWRRGATGQVSQTCDEAEAGSPGYTELVFVLTAHRTGAELRSVTVEYSVDDRRYRTRIPWQMTLCGTSKALRQTCRT